MKLFDKGVIRAQGYRDITPQQLHDNRGVTRIVDVREPQEFNGELGHVPGAELIPLGSLSAQAMGWDRAAPLVVICRSGGRSSRAAEMLVSLGFLRVINVEGGMNAHAAAQLPVAPG
jgi:rhodanese-related sulfurtransferase